MFDDLAPVYDRSNRVISGALDRYWRRRTVAALDLGAGDRVLDLGTGTGDLAYRAADALPEPGPVDRDRGGTEAGAARVVGVDVARAMIREARRKRPRDAGGVRFVQASALDLPLEPGTFTAVASAFALRNVGDRRGFAEAAYRVLAPGGGLAVLELYPPRDALLAPLYRFYFHRVVPRLGRVVSGDPAAYEYLSESVQEMVPPGHVTQVLEGVGFEDVGTRDWFGGLATLHEARKPGTP